MQLGTRPNPWYCVPVVRGSPACGRGICEYHSMSGYLLQGHSCPKERGIWPRLEGLAAGRCNLNPVSAAFPRPPRDSAIEPVLKRSHMEQTERNCHRSCSHMPQEQSGSDCWTQLHGHRPLHRGDARVPQSGSTIEGGEGGGATRFISGSKRCLPWPCKLLMHFRKEWHRRGFQRDPPPEKPLVQPRRVVTRWRIPHEPDVLGGPGKHSRHLWVWLGQRYHTRRGQRSRVVIPGERGLALRCSDRHLVIRGGTEGNGWGTPLSRGPSPNQRYPAGCGVPEGWETPLVEALTVILRSPLTPPDAVPPRLVPGRMPDRGGGRGTPPCLTQRSLLRNSEMVMSPQEEHEPSTKASSACWMPRHVRQWSWPSWGARDRPHPETHGW